MTLPNEIRAIVVEDAHLGCHRSARQQWWAVKDSNLGPGRAGVPPGGTSRDTAPGSDPGGDPTDRHRRGWLASPDERKLQNNFDTGAGESRGDGVETTAPLTASGWAGAARLSARGRGRRPTLPLYRTARGLTGLVVVVIAVWIGGRRERRGAH